MAKIIVHWETFKKGGLPSCFREYEHEPEKMTVNDEIKVLWDFPI